jgi:hypothetical protein
MVQRWSLPTVLGAITLAALIGATQAVLQQATGDFARDHLWIVGDYIEWRWSLAVSLGAVTAIAGIAYFGAIRETVDKTHTTLDRSVNASVLSDGIKWVVEGWRYWPTGDRELEVFLECADHGIPLLNWAYNKRPEPIARAFGKPSFRGLYCPGQEGEGGHVLDKLSESKTLDIARRVAVARLKGKLGAAAS